MAVALLKKNSKGIFSEANTFFPDLTSGRNRRGNRKITGVLNEHVRHILRPFHVFFFPKGSCCEAIRGVEKGMGIDIIVILIIIAPLERDQNSREKSTSPAILATFSTQIPLTF